ncbi:uncharacterized protein LOC130521345, partial [Takifugu flavidus]|uniref:uncharacterized protein LOC130521345 n=1 Tax=Takifugu flavidus TaxID=433684 RepID=UPI002543FEC5
MAVQRFTAEMVVGMLQKGLEDEDNDPAYVSQGQAGVMGVSLLNEEDSSDDQEGSSDESPEEEIQTHDNIIEEVLKCTNLEGRRAAAVKGKDWKSIDKEEFLAFIGLTLLAGGDKSWDVALRELFLDPLQNPFTRPPWVSGDMKISVASYGLTTGGPGLCDWKQTTWRHSDTCGSAFWTTAEDGSSPVTVSPLTSSWCRSGAGAGFTIYAQQAGEYGLKIFWMCDARVPYTIDGTVYTGRQPGEEIKKKLGETVVQQLCSGIRGTGRNITMDNFFTSVPLAEKLLEKDLTIVGTLRQNKADIPPVMKPSKLREIYSSEFGFRGNMTMVSYVPKKGKSVVLLSTMHDDKAVDESNHKKKPDVILFYNQTKGGVDIMDQMVSAYTCKRRTRRWPMVLWSNMLDVATLNALASFTSQHPGYMSGISN